MSATSDPADQTKMVVGDRSRAEKLRQKRIDRKNKRKTLLAQAAKTVASRPKGTEGISTNWEKLKNIMGIQDNEQKTTRQATLPKPVNKSQYQGPTKVVALDCEMVGVGPGGRENMLARVTLVNTHGNIIYDRYVKPRETVVDYRTRISGIRPENLRDGAELSEVQKEVSDLLKDRILVGHDLRHDFEVMFLSHPNWMTRDTALYRPFREMFGGRTPSLKNLAHRILDLNIQEGEHSSAQDAQVTMKLYLQYQKRWEEEAKKRTNRMKRKRDRRLEKAAKQQISQKKVEPKQQQRRQLSDESDDEQDDDGSDHSEGP